MDDNVIGKLGELVQEIDDDVIGKLGELVILFSGVSPYPVFLTKTGF